MIKKGKWTVPGKMGYPVNPRLNAHPLTGYKEKFGDLNLM
jgi:hypothetical protein